MKRDKEWFKKHHRDVWSDFYRNLEGMGKLRDRIEDLIDQLEEPTKVIIPQFVADYISFSKGQGNSPRVSMYESQISKELNDWLAKTEDYMTYPNQEKFMRAWLDGYEVEKEPTWVVKAVSGDYVDRFFNRGTSIQVFISSGAYMTEAHKFEDKSHADAVALLIKGTVEEL